MFNQNSLNSKLVIDTINIQGEDIETLKVLVDNLQKQSLTDKHINKILDRLPFTVENDKVIFKMDIAIDNNTFKEIVHKVNALQGVEEVDELEYRLENIEEAVNKIFVNKTINDKTVHIISNDLYFQRDNGTIICLNELLKKIEMLEETLLNSQQTGGVTMNLNVESSFTTEQGEKIKVADLVNNTNTVVEKCSNIVDEDVLA